MKPSAISGYRHGNSFIWQQLFDWPALQHMLVMEFDADISRI